jgi:plastocyanin
MLRFFLGFILGLLLASNAEAADIKGIVEGGKRIKKSPVVVYLADASGEYVKPAANPTLDQRNMTFIPQVLPVQIGTTVDFLNNDEVKHNVFSPDHEKYNLGTWPKGAVKQYTFTKKGVYTQLCNVHPEMESYIVALDTPYFALTDKNGNFELQGVPPGNYTIKVWHEKLRFKKQQIAVTEKGVENLVFERKKRR